ncbi:hypothetical protein Hanom_Chr02g00142611 [Helianthus anomalus]
MIEKYQGCKKELESTQITCEKWVESYDGFEMLLIQHTKSNVKFGIGFSDSDNKDSEDNIHINSKMIEVTPTNSRGKEIKITKPNGKKIIP